MKIDIENFIPDETTHSLVNEVLNRFPQKSIMLEVLYIATILFIAKGLFNKILIKNLA